MRKRKIRIGIDPAFRASGFTICIIDEDNTVGFKVFKNGFHDFQLWLIGEDSPVKAISIVENSNLQNITFDMKGSKAVIARKSRNVGKNQAASQYTYDACRVKWGADAFEVSPKQKGKKLTEQQFQSMARMNNHKVKNKTTQDERDAYKLAMFPPGILLQMRTNFKNSKF